MQDLASGCLAADPRSRQGSDRLAEQVEAICANLIGQSPLSIRGSRQAGSDMEFVRILHLTCTLVSPCKSSSREDTPAGRH